MPFDPQSSKIAITVPRFKLLKHSDSVFERYNEPYIVSVAADSGGNAGPSLGFNFMEFPKVRVGGSVDMLGHGHLVYGPKNPGEFVAISILIMESDRDIREAARLAEAFVKSKAVELGMRAVMAANPGSGAVLGILKELVQFVAGELKNNRDDELFRTEGSFLRDSPNPYHVNRSYQQSNDYVELSLNIIPLETPNGEGRDLTHIPL